MADQRGGGISWTEETWNPLRGCSRISEGCRNCYAEAVAARFSGKDQPYEGLAKSTKDGGRWTGKVVLVEDKLEQPLRWKRARRLFVNSMSDLFHETLSDLTISRIFDVMLKAPHHTYQTLTKRADRMHEYLSTSKHLPTLPKNIWLGISVENQKAAEERIPFLLKSPAITRWLSIEPMLGPIVLKPEWLMGVDWVVVGGESGPDSRPFDINWARAIIAQCKMAGVAVFFKQYGSAAMEAGVPLEYKGKGSEPEDWPKDLQIRNYPEAR